MDLCLGQVVPPAALRGKSPQPAKVELGWEVQTHD